MTSLHRFDRRQVLAGSGAVALAAVPGLAQAERLIPQRVSARVVVDNDFFGDPDGLVALAHQLLAHKTRTVLVTSSFVDTRFKVPGVIVGQTARQGAELARELIERLAPAQRPPVVAGAEGPPGARPANPAAQAIVAEAMRDDPLPLFFTCGGPLTNLAEALALEPRIAGRMTVVWIGGGGYPAGGWEYNLAMDAEAARAVIERSTLPLWQLPQPAYRQMLMSVAEMTADVRPISTFSRWLYDRFTTPPDFVDLSGAWPMGDSPLVLLTAIGSESSRWRDLPARRIAPDLTYGEEVGGGRTVRVFETVDARLCLADFVASLRLHAARHR